MSFKDYYKFPLRQDPGLPQVKVRTADFKIAFDWGTKILPHEREAIIQKINGAPMIMQYKTLYDAKNGTVNYGLFFDKTLLRIRGLGMLIDEPYHLSPEKAKEIQDEFGEYIVTQLNK